MSEIIGTSPQVITEYLGEAETVFNRIRDRMQQLVTRAFSLTYEGPNAEQEFNPGLIKLATLSVGEMDRAMGEFARAVSQITSNISQSLGASAVTLTYTPRALELPPAPGVTSNDYKIDITGFESFLGTDLPETRTTLGALIAENQAAFNVIPRASASQRGWSGQSREHAQNVVVPAQTENLNNILNQVVEQISVFMTNAKDGAVRADQAGVGGS